MHVNEGYPAGIKPLTPYGTNSTLFTECCGCAINEEECCPCCGRKIVGHDAPYGERHRIRWKNATERWNK